MSSGLPGMPHDGDRPGDARAKESYPRGGAAPDRLETEAHVIKAKLDMVQGMTANPALAGVVQ